MFFYRLIIYISMFALAGCGLPLEESPTSAASRVQVAFANIPGWNNDQHAAAISVFLNSCQKLGDEWQESCDAAVKLSTIIDNKLPNKIDDEKARLFWQRYFIPYKLLNHKGDDSGLITGYYEPLLQGALSPSARYQYPIYARPDDLLEVALADLYPSLKGRRIRGRLHKGRIIPYYSRADIDGARAPLAGNELLWGDDKVALFFLHIQGSGLAQLADGRIIGVGYQDQNGHAYRSIGKILAQRGEMELSKINLFSIRRWLAEHPQQADDLLNENPSYIFFTRRDKIEAGPQGSLGVALTPRRSLAVDKSIIPLGAPVFLSTVMPDDEQTPLRQLMIAQDTGGAIQGEIRADFFWGRGDTAERMAGLMKTRGQLFVLLPRQ